MRRILLVLATMLAAVLVASGVALAKPISNTATITINDDAAADPYPSTIEVSGLSGTIEDVNLKLRGYSHTCPDDVDVLLVGPTEANALVMSDVGACDDVRSKNLVLDDEATDFLPDTTQIRTGTYKPTRGTADEGLPVPADFPQTGTDPPPTGPYGTTLSVFDGTDPNGTWKLYVIDDSFADSGQIARGWVLTIRTAP